MECIKDVEGKLRAAKPVLSTPGPVFFTRRPPTARHVPHGGLSTFSRSCGPVFHGIQEAKRVRSPTIISWNNNAGHSRRQIASVAQFNAELLLGTVVNIGFVIQLCPITRAVRQFVVPGHSGHYFPFFCVPDSPFNPRGPDIIVSDTVDRVGADIRFLLYNLLPFFAHLENKTVGWA